MFKLLALKFFELWSTLKYEVEFDFGTGLKKYILFLGQIDSSLVCQLYSTDNLNSVDIVSGEIF